MVVLGGERGEEVKEFRYLGIMLYKLGDRRRNKTKGC